MIKSLKVALVAAAALGGVSLVADSASAMPITGFDGAAATTQPVVKAGWVCGPYRCFYRRPYYRPYYRRYYY